MNDNETNAPTIKLLPCPFCGEMPEVVEKVNHDYQPPGEWSFNLGAKEGESIACVNKMCGMRPYTHPSAPGNLRAFIHNWNERAALNEADALRAEVEEYRTALQNLVHTVEKSSLIAAVWMGSGRRDAEIEQIVGAKNIAIATLKEHAAIKPNAAAGEEGTDGK